MPNLNSVDFILREKIYFPNNEKKGNQKISDNDRRLMVNP